MQQKNKNTNTNFIYLTYNCSSDVNTITNKRVCVAKDDILRIWENVINVKIFLKSKQNNPKEQQFITVNTPYDDIIKQL